MRASVAKQFGMTRVDSIALSSKTAMPDRPVLCLTGYGSAGSAASLLL
jgi:hypothetical protein